MVILKVALSTILAILIILNGILLIDYFDNLKYKRLEKRRRERDRGRYMNNFYKK